jgi:hypothetical protein
LPLARPARPGTDEARELLRHHGLESWPVVCSFRYVPSMYWYVPYYSMVPTWI